MVALTQIIGASGLVLISAGILIKKRKQQDVLYIVGGLCLLIYSIAIRDVIFIILQSIFTAAAVFDLVRIDSRKQI